LKRILVLRNLRGESRKVKSRPYLCSCRDGYKVLVGLTVIPLWVWGAIRCRFEVLWKYSEGTSDTKSSDKNALIVR
jgi:hypothetical protein